jgi:hypothetical protein
MKQKCMINEIDYCEHDDKSVIITGSNNDSNCCHYDDTWYEIEVNICPVCGYQPERLSEKTPQGDAIV